jgi:hypothetical protein
VDLESGLKMSLDYFRGAVAALATTRA